ncbi:hypothetical protein LXL04_004816 [Taraxacum kok-saghyz]
MVKKIIVEVTVAGNGIIADFGCHFLFAPRVYQIQTQESILYHKELSALSMGARGKARTCTACIVNGVRFMVLTHDAHRTTQNSGVHTVGENGEKYYGQLEEIFEIRYPYWYSTVLFRCKWFGTRRGVICENNINSIDTQREWHRDDQLIFTTQAKQVFYIREPSRGDQRNNHRWVVEEVNHRKIWDLPINDTSIVNVANGSNESVDVIHSESSSSCIFSIDFSQYFTPQLASTANEELGEEGVEVVVGPIPTTLNEESDGEIDYDDDECEYDSEISEDDTEVSEGEIDENMLRMMMIWYIVLHLMADVMGRGHGVMELRIHLPLMVEDMDNRRWTMIKRGKTKNLQLTPTWIKNGRQPLPLTFDAYTGTTVGEIHDLLIRKMDIIISRDIPLDKHGWRKVPAKEKNALLEHLRPYFDVDSVMVDPEKVRLRAAFETMLANSYKGQKNNANRHFNRLGGYQDIERARNTPPPPSNITPENWRKVVDFFTGESHMTISQRNKNNRALQKPRIVEGLPLIGKDRVGIYFDAHTNKNGEFEDPADEEHYIEEETQVVASSSSTQTRVNEAAIFEKVLGPRRGRIRGIEIKPSTMPTSRQYDEGHPRTSQQTHLNTVDAIISDPRLRETVSTIYQSLSTQHPVNDEGTDEGSDEDDE